MGLELKGDFQPSPDIDLTFRGSNLAHNLMLEISNQIDDLLSPYKVDLSLHASPSPGIKDHLWWVG